MNGKNGAQTVNPRISFNKVFPNKLDGGEGYPKDGVLVGEKQRNITGGPEKP